MHLRGKETERGGKQRLLAAGKAVAGAAQAVAKWSESAGGWAEAVGAELTVAPQAGGGGGMGGNTPLQAQACP